MPAPIDREVSREERMTKAVELYLKCRSYRQVAQELGCSTGLVHRYIHRTIDRWRESRVGRIAADRELTIRKLELVAREAITAWEKSKEPTQEVIVEETDSGKGVRKTTRKRVIRRNGDVAYLREFRESVSLVADILGLKEPVKLVVSQVIQPIEVEIQSPEDVLTVSELLAATTGARESGSN